MNEQKRKRQKYVFNIRLKRNITQEAYKLNHTNKEITAYTNKMYLNKEVQSCSNIKPWKLQVCTNPYLLYRLVSLRFFIQNANSTSTSPVTLQSCSEHARAEKTFHWLYSIRIERNSRSRLVFWTNLLSEQISLAHFDSLTPPRQTVVRANSIRVWSV